MEELLNIIKFFSDNFNKKAWLLTNSMDIDVAKEGVEVYKLKGIEEAEKVLVKYYTEKDGLEKI